MLVSFGLLSYLDVIQFWSTKLFKILMYGQMHEHSKVQCDYSGLLVLRVRCVEYTDGCSPALALL